MTHDELLKLLHIEQGYDIGNAIIAVVKLHKPIMPELGFETLHTTYCEGCSIYEIIDWAKCPTIQAIEKELA